ncbi:hypothetical protein [Pelotalea chapellei]|uniref:Uncharacterized protein n=1 Tax=Pelotalea chapellei TaxID=44671 RepID=A0ABS5UCX4_9BACT|nr:hypothetical protein [Pelotalea chapellei]MBT1073547.1 hypothetical protein [Pelotalea chapellei]
MEQLIEMYLQLQPIDIIKVILWGLAAAISFSFSIGNARVWTSISLGFFLIFFSQAYHMNPWAISYYKISAFHNIIGTVAVMVITHGFLEYYVFCRTFEISGKKVIVYLSTLLLLAASGAFLFINPTPSPNTIRNIKMIENAIWVFLSLMNLELIRKIYLAIKDSTISKAFIAFGVVFLCIFLWKGAELYLQIFQWDRDWQDIIAVMTDEVSDIDKYPLRVAFSETVRKYAGVASSVSVGGTFIYIYRLLR